MSEGRKQTAVRLSQRGREIVKAAQQKLGLSVTGVIELALRRLDEIEGLAKHESER